MRNDSAGLAREAEDDRRHAEPGDGQEQVATGPLQAAADGPGSGAISKAPTDGAARSAAEPGRADLKDVLGVDRQQRHRPAEQHGEHVERDRGQDQRRVRTRTGTRPTGWPTSSSRASRLHPGPAVGSRRSSSHHDHAADAIGQEDAAWCGANATDPEPAPSPGRPSRRPASARPPRHGVVEVRLGHQLRHERPPRRERERARHADHAEADA